MLRAVGLAALTVLDVAPPRQIEIAAEAGYSHVGLRLIPATPAEVRHAMVGDTPMAREAAHLLAETGIKVLDVEIFRLTPDVHIADFEPAIASAARLGAQYMLVAGNDVQEVRLRDNFLRLCELARRYSLVACLEPMPWTDIPDLAAGRRIVEADETAGLLIDAIHFFRADNRLEDLRLMPARRLPYMQLCDAGGTVPTEMAEMIRQARSDRLFPGDGELDLRGLLRALPADIPVSLEVPVAQRMEPQERARRALAAAQRLLT